MNRYFERLLERRPELAACMPAIDAVHAALANCFQNGGRVYLCGNGGSAADAEHWAGELLKGFYSKRPLARAEKRRLPAAMAARLQGGLPAIPLTGFTALRTAVANDIDAELEFAQLVWVLGRPGDVLVCLSTSGKARNVIAAAHAAKARGMRVLGLAGKEGGRLKTVADVCVRAPADLTHEIQEYHLAIYHAISLALEEDFFARQ